MPVHGWYPLLECVPATQGTGGIGVGGVGVVLALRLLENSVPDELAPSILAARFLPDEPAMAAAWASSRIAHGACAKLAAHEGSETATSIATATLASPGRATRWGEP